MTNTSDRSRPWPACTTCPSTRGCAARHARRRAGHLPPALHPLPATGRRDRPGHRRRRAPPGHRHARRRRDIDTLPRIRDNALITLGRTHAEITAALLAALTTTRLAATGHPAAGLYARLGKAAGVDAAVRAVTELAPLIGASGYQRSHPVARARADLTGLLCADGVHDSLYRSGGTGLLTVPATTRPAPLAAAA